MNDQGSEGPMNASTRGRVVRRLDQMVRSGRLTEAEAEGVRAAAGPWELEEAVRRIRVRHTGAKLTAAVESGGMTRDEADAYLERLTNGEHPRSLRAHLRRLRPGST